MKTAVFLGAGASKTFGYPLTAELLPRILHRLKDDILFNGANSKSENAEDREWFRARLFQMLPGLADATDGGKSPDKPIGVGITDLLTLVDRALLHAEARAGMAPEELGRFRELLERAIYEALLRKNQRGSGEAQRRLTQFTKWLTKEKRPVGVITTNYDRAVDLRLFKHVSGDAGSIRNRDVAGAVDFGFPWRQIISGSMVPRPGEAPWQLLKLHGSVNWLKCSLCGQIYVNVKSTVGRNAFARELDEWNTCHCNDWSRLRLHLVTPSFVRHTNDAHLLGIWQAALELLRTASRWVIIGYSLPAEDVAIRSLFLRAWDGHALPKKPDVLVVQRERKETEQTYRAFFPGRNLDYRTSGLEAFLDKETA